jgi:hypothetical protein
VNDDALVVPLRAATKQERNAARSMFGLRPPLCDLALAPFRTCQWIEGEPTRTAAMCGAPSVHGTSWCADHHARVFRDTQASRLNAERAHDPHLAFGIAARARRWRRYGR